MNGEMVDKLARYRVDRAKESLEAARLLFDQGHLHACVNRLYYACFYAISALLLLEGYSSPKHSGIRSLLHQKLVKPGIITVTAGQIYNKLFDTRQKADYLDLVEFDSTEVTM